MIFECKGTKVPIDDDLSPQRVIDLDSSNIVAFMNGGNPNAIKRADCFIVYSTITAIMETKSSYPERALPQLRKTAERIYESWDDFLSVVNLGQGIPKPTAFYFVAENGLGKSSYEVDKNQIIRKKSRDGSKRHSPETIKNYPIKVYSKIQIDNSYKLTGVK